jgi:membrane-bound serine protease (ClpP class)
MFKTIRLMFLLGIFVAAFTSIAVQAKAPTVEVLTAKGVVNPILADYIQRGILQAEKDNAIALIIQLDTPGGLDSSMRDIVQDMIASTVPVVVYVAPSGARAASAGVFITEASNIAAMAPNTAIGAAHPVSMDSSGGVTNIPSDEAVKVLNDAAAYIRTIAQSHGRNMDWAEQAVRQSVSATETEALKMNVVDIIAPDLKSLISQLDGRSVAVLGGANVTLKTANAGVQYNPMTSIEKFLYAISDPNIAYLLLSVATLGIMAELSNPGLIFPGVIGAICLLIAFFSLGMLPVNYTGILLIVLAFGLFIGEVFTGMGVLAAGGIASLVLGSSILFKGGPLFAVSPWLIGIVTAVIAGFFIFIVARVVIARRSPATTGWEELIGKSAVVKVALAPEGMVLFRGERWKAISETGTIKPGEEVKIDRVENLTLHVSRKDKN